MQKILRKLIIFLSGLYPIKTNPSTKVNASMASLDNKDLMNMVDCSLGMWLTEGKWNETFEKKLSDYLGINFVASCNSGSSGNLLALSSLTSPQLKDRQIKLGDEVITVACGFPTTVFPILQLGLIPVFCDIDRRTLNININQIEEAITPRTKAIMMANTLGNPNDWDRIREIANKHGLWIVQDNCDSLATTYKGKHIQGDIATFSFFPAHEICTGEGGAVATNDPKLARIISSFKNWGRDCRCRPGEDNICGIRFNQQSGKLPVGFDHKYTFTHLGYNLKTTDWQTAIGCSQMEKLAEFTKKRKANYEYLKHALFQYSEFITLPMKMIVDSDPVWFGLPIIFKKHEKYNKKDLVAFLNEKGIMTREIFAGNILRQPVFTGQPLYVKIRNSGFLDSSKLEPSDYLPETEWVAEHGFWIGCHPSLTRSDRHRILKAFEEYFVGGNIL